MPITAKAVNERRESFTVAWGGDTATITYRAGEAGRLTQDDLEAWQAKGKELEASGDENAARALMAEMVCRLVVAWDVLDESGAMYPLDIEHVSVLDPEFTMTVVFGVLEDLRAKKTNGILSRVLSGATSSVATQDTASTSSQADVSPSSSTAS